MAHLVDVVGGKASMAYTGNVPWHGLGNKVPVGSSIDVWASEGAVNYDVLESVVQYHIPGFRGAAIPFSFDNKKVLYRGDTMEPLSVVGKGYNVVQPIEILEFYKDLVDNYGWEIHTVGSLDGGKKVWALAKMLGSVRIKGQDKLDQYSLLVTSYDTTLSTTLLPTTVRVVCHNTLSYAYDNGSSGMIKVPHYEKFDPKKVKIEAGLLDDTFGEFSEKIGTMADAKITDDFAVKFFMNLMHDKAMGDDYSDVLEDGPKSKAIQSMVEQYSAGAGHDMMSADDTLWGALNAVTAYVDHYKPSFSTNNRFKGSQFGAGAKMKKDAWAAASDYLEKIAA